jgi:hypothetical protein
MPSKHRNLAETNSCFIWFKNAKNGISSFMLTTILGVVRLSFAAAGVDPRSPETIGIASATDVLRPKGGITMNRRSISDVSEAQREPL